MITRREFLDTLAVSAAGVAVTSNAKSYAQIMGANDRVNFAVIGLNSRAYAHLSSLKANQKNARIAYVCDVDTPILEKITAKTEAAMGSKPTAEKDFRKVLALKEIDAITIRDARSLARPHGHHAGVEAGKHVYGREAALQPQPCRGCDARRRPR